MPNRPYAREAVLGMIILPVVFGGLYLLVGMSGHVPFSALALIAVLIVAVPGGAVLGASFAADTDTDDN